MFKKGKWHRGSTNRKQDGTEENLSPSLWTLTAHDGQTSTEPEPQLL